jgi:hypothetical protein
VSSKLVNMISQSKLTYSALILFVVLYNVTPFVYNDIRILKSIRMRIKTSHACDSSQFDDQFGKLFRDNFH